MRKLTEFNIEIKKNNKKNPKFLRILYIYLNFSRIYLKILRNVYEIFK